MSNFFNYFPNEFYKFGNEKTSDIFQNISIYADVIDQVKDISSTYIDYYIQEGLRPDQVSQQLYNTSNYHWTFYLMNDKLREQGWPSSNVQVLKKAQKDYPNITITTRTDLTTLTGFFKTGDTVEGRTSGATGKINHRHLDLGQLVISNIGGGPFIAGELLETSGTVNTVNVQTISDEYLSAHHYENASGEVVDIDPTVGPGAQLTEITYLDRMYTENNNLKQIRVLKPSLADQIVSSFREAITRG